MENKKFIGIDLGTINSAVAVIENGNPTVIPNSEGSRTTPSIVGFRDGECKIGEAARRQRVVNADKTIVGIKRLMGVEYKDCEKIISHLPYKVADVNGKPRVVIDDRKYSPEEISSFILRKMKKTAEDYLGGEVTDAVITCPAWFDNSAREATKLAGEMAGLKVHRIISEPTSAILAAGIKADDGKTVRVLVADIGGGTTDFSVCELSYDADEKQEVRQILASHGDVFLGGSDFDNAIADWLIAEFKADYDIDIKKDTQALQRVIEAAENAKIELSSATSTEINLPYISMKDNAPVHLIKTLTRAKMEQLTSHLVEKIIDCGVIALKVAKVAYDELDCILLVGGQSRSLAIQNALEKTFGVTLNKSVNPDEAVAIGAATQANMLAGGSSDVLLLDVTPLTLGIETLGGVMTSLVEANTTIPCHREQIFSTAMDNQPSVTINVLQGERPMAKDNKSIGLFNLDGIAPARRGIPQIVVSFDIDANGILSVSAKDKATDKEQHITIESKHSLSDEEINRIKKEAEMYAEEDAKTRKKLDDANKCESLIYSTEQTVESLSEKITDEEKEFFKGKVEKLKEMKEKEDYADLETIEKEIQEKWYGITAKAYANNGGNNFNFGDPFNNFMNAQGGMNQQPNEENVDVQDAK